MSETEALCSLCESQTLIHQLSAVTAKVNDGLEDEDGPESSQEVIFGEEMQVCTPQEA